MKVHDIGHNLSDEEIIQILMMRHGEKLATKAGEMKHQNNIRIMLNLERNVEKFTNMMEKAAARTQTREILEKKVNNKAINKYCACLHRRQQLQELNRILDEDCE